MGRAYSDDLRGRVLDAVGSGLSANAAARRFGVGIATAVRWAAMARSGRRTARPMGRARGSRLDAHAAFVEGLIAKQKDITLAEMMARLAADRSVVIGRSRLSAWLRARGWRFKNVWPAPLASWLR